MNVEQVSETPGRSPFEAVAHDLSSAVDTAYPIDELSHPEYVNDDFRMFTFKVMKCPKRYVHDWRSCPFAHPTENARRRDPREVKYMPVPCPDYKRGLCLMGDACTYSHGVYECWLHPAKYRTQLCKDGAQCRRPVCFFAHSVSELRSPTYTWENGETTSTSGRQASVGLQEGALPQPRQAPGNDNHGPPCDRGPLPYPNHGLGHHTHAFQYPQQSHPQHPPLHDHLDPNQAAMYPYPPAQQPQAYMDPYYAPHQNLNQGMDGYLGMPMHPSPNGLQMGDPNQAGFSAPGQAVGGPRMYPQAPGPYVDVSPTMGGLHHGNPYQREQQRLQTMQRFHSQQLSHQQYQHQRPQPHHQPHQQPYQQHQQQAQRQQSGPAPAGSLPSPTAGSTRSGAPSADLGELLGPGAGQGTTAPRMSNAMARSLGLVPPKETRTRTLGALAGLIQGPRATSLTDGLNRPQMSYSLPAQLPDPDQHMHEVYLAAQAAAAAGNNTQVQNSASQSSTQRQASQGLPPAMVSMGSGALGMPQGLSQTLRQASAGSVSRQPSLGLQGQGSLGLAPGSALIGTQRQVSMGPPPDMGQGNVGMPFETSPQDMQAWQMGMQQGMEQALQLGSGQGEGAAGGPSQTGQQAQERALLEQMQNSGLTDGTVKLSPGQLQGIVAILNKQGLHQPWNRSSTSLAGHTIPEAEQLADGPVDSHTMASLLSSFQTMGLIPDQHTKNSYTDPHAQAVTNQAHMATPFASPEHAPALDFLEGGDAKTVGSRRMRTQSSARAGQLSGGTPSLASSSSSGAGGLPSKNSAGLNTYSPFASPNQQLHKMSSASSMGSGPGRSPSGRTSQNPSCQMSSPAPHSPNAAAT
ncbi:hypothetical protein WJX77_002528 [Trebouxia sp. C0004]